MQTTAPKNILNNSFDPIQITDITEKLLELSKRIFGDFMEMDKVTTSALTVSEAGMMERLKKHWSCNISMMNESFLGNFNIYFNSSMAMEILSSIEDNPDINLSIEMMKEFCNLFAGHLKGSWVMGSDELVIGIPYSARTFDDLFRRPEKKLIEVYWEISVNGSKALCAFSADSTN